MRSKSQTKTKLVSGESFGDVVLVYNGTVLEATDTDARVLPYKPYQYMVISINAAGNANSPWAEVTTRQGAPTFVAPPLILVSFYPWLYW
jgi:hypothetical protein